MPQSDVDLLRQSPLVSRIVSVVIDGIAGSYTLKVRVELRNGWLMDCWEHQSPGLRRYSFHVFHGDRMVVRWDYAPHHPRAGTFPCHKHVGTDIEDSEDMDVAGVLVELEGLM